MKLFDRFKKKKVEESPKINIKGTEFDPKQFNAHDDSPLIVSTISLYGGCHGATIKVYTNHLELDTFRTLARSLGLHPSISFADYKTKNEQGEEVYTSACHVITMENAAPWQYELFKSRIKNIRGITYHQRNYVGVDKVRVIESHRKLQRDALTLYGKTANYPIIVRNHCIKDNRHVVVYTDKPIDPNSKEFNTIKSFEHIGVEPDHRNKVVFVDVVVN